MSKRDTRPIEVGDRFETRDKRDAGKVVEVDFIDKTYFGERRYRIRTEVNPNNPSTVGRSRLIADRTLRNKYKRVSR